MDSDEALVDLGLTDEQRWLLWRGLLEWTGPARCTQEMAVAMGFVSVERMFDEIKPMRDLLKGDPPWLFSRVDWTRILLATEVVFASSVLGAGSDWSIVTGLSDAKTISLLREVQRNFARLRVRVQIGTRPVPEPGPQGRPAANGVLRGRRPCWSGGTAVKIRPGVVPDRR